MKTFNSDVFITHDENINGIHHKRVNILYVLTGIALVQKQQNITSDYSSCQELWKFYINLYQLFKINNIVSMAYMLIILLKKWE